VEPAPVPAARPADSRRARAGAVWVVFADSLGWAAIVPVLPYYAERLGAGPAGVGLLISLYAACQAVSAPLLGRAADRFGHRVVLVACLAGSCLSFLWLAAAGSFAAVLGSRLLDGITAGNLPVAQAWLAESTLEPDRARAFNALAMAVGAGFLAGPLVAVAALGAGPRAAVLAGAACSALSVLAAWILVPRPGARRPGPGRGPASRPKGRSLARPAILLALACLFAAYQLFTSGFPLFAERTYWPGGHGFGARELSLVYAFVGVSALATQLLLANRLVRRLGEPAATALAFALGAAGAAILGLPRDWPGILAAAGLCGSGLALLRPLLAARLSREAGPGRQGAAMGLSQSIQSVLQVVAPLAAGGLISRGRLGTWHGLLVGFLLFGLGWTLRPSKKRSGQRDRGDEAVEPVQDAPLPGEQA